MNRSIRVLLIAALALAGLSCLAQQSATAAAKPVPSPSLVAKAQLPSEATVSGFLKKMFGWNPELTWRIAEIKPSEAEGISEVVVIFSTPKGQQASRIYVTADQKYAFTGELAPFGADPFAAARQELKAANGPTHGPAEAAVTIVEFGDLECPACKQAQPNISKLMEEEPKARLIFQNFPLEQIHKWALIGAKYLDCLGRQNNDQAEKFISLVYDHQVEINEQNVEQMLKGYIKEVGGDPEAVAACAAKSETGKRVRDSLALGEQLGITSTPTFFINGRKIVGFANNIPYDVFKSMVDFAAGDSGK
jgi:protein-disulfide isomerase